MRVYLFLKYLYNESERGLCGMETNEKLQRVIQRKFLESLLQNEKGEISDFHIYNDLLFVTAAFNRYNLFVREAFCRRLLGTDTFDKSVTDSRIFSFPRGIHTYLSFYNVEEAKLVYDFVSQNSDYGAAAKKYAGGGIGRSFNVEAFMTLIMKYLSPTLYADEINDVLPTLLEEEETAGWLKEHHEKLYQLAVEGICYPQCFSKETMLCYMAYLDPNRLADRVRPVFQSHKNNGHLVGLARKESDFYYYIHFLDWLDKSLAASAVNNVFRPREWKKYIDGVLGDGKLKYLALLKTNRYRRMAQLNALLCHSAMDTIKSFSSHRRFFNYARTIGFSFNHVPPDYLAGQFQVQSFQEAIRLLKDIKALKYDKMPQLVKAFQAMFNRTLNSRKYKLDHLVNYQFWDFKFELKAPDKRIREILLNATRQEFAHLLMRAEADNQLFYRVLKTLSPSQIVHLITERDEEKKNAGSGTIYSLVGLAKNGYPRMVELMKHPGVLKLLMDRKNYGFSLQNQVLDLLKAHNPGEYDNLRRKLLAFPGRTTIVAFQFEPRDFEDYYRTLPPIAVLRHLKRLREIEYPGLALLLRRLPMKEILGRLGDIPGNGEDAETIMQLVNLYKGFKTHAGAVLEKILVDYGNRLFSLIVGSPRIKEEVFDKLVELKGIDRPAFTRVVARLHSARVMERLLQNILNRRYVSSHEVVTFLKYLEQMEYPDAGQLINDTPWFKFDFYLGSPVKFLPHLKHYGYDGLRRLSRSCCESNSGQAFIVSVFNHIRLGLPIEDIHAMTPSMIYGKLKDRGDLPKVLFFLECLWKTGYFEGKPRKRALFFSRYFNFAYFKKKCIKGFAKHGYGYNKMKLLLNVLEQIAPSLHDRLLAFFLAKPPMYVNYSTSRLSSRHREKELLYTAALKHKIALNDSHYKEIKSAVYSEPRLLERLLKNHNESAVDIDIDKIIPPPTEINRLLKSRQMPLHRLTSILDVLRKIKYPKFQGYVKSLSRTAIMELLGAGFPLRSHTIAALLIHLH